MELRVKPLSRIQPGSARLAAWAESPGGLHSRPTRRGGQGWPGFPQPSMTPRTSACSGDFPMQGPGCLSVLGLSLRP